ncbi:MAG: deoxyribonuclease IV [Firmicutes bacterium]|nr:deoxyribonuclease IV [Bacillota bacterium]
MIIGSHVSFGKEQLLGSVKEAISYGANTFMFYTGAPQNTLRKSIDENLSKEARKLMKENDIDINNVICHAPYIINLANNDESKYNFSITFLKGEVTRCEDLGIKYLVLHPGSSVGLDRNIALDNIVYALNQVLKSETKIMILLETMAGKGTEIGRSLEEIKYIINNIIEKGKIGVCIDTCHLNDAGYNIKEFDNFLDEFDKVVGINYIKCVHVNDSKNDINTHKDRHANIGYGTLGFNTILNVITNTRLKDVPKILETPYIGEHDEDKERIYPPYKFEIEMLRNGIFNENLLEDIRNYYKNLK